MGDLKFHYLLFPVFFLHAVFLLFFIFECTLPVIIIFVDLNTCLHSCFVSAQDRTPSDMCCFALEVLHFDKTYTQPSWLNLSQHLLGLQQQNIAKHYLVQHFVAARNLRRRRFCVIKTR